MNLTTKLFDTALCLKEAAEMLRLVYPDSIHIGQLEGAATMLEEWINDIESENKKGDYYEKESNRT